MAHPTHHDEVGTVPTWMIVLLGLTWLVMTVATIAYVAGIGPLA